MTHLRGQSRREFLSIAAGAALVGSTRPAFAAYPDRNVTVVVPFTPGGPNDIIGRQVAQILSEAFGVPAIVENRPGAGGALGLSTTARADADGYSLVLPSGVSLIALPIMQRQTPYRVEDLRQVTVVTAAPSVVAVRQGLEARTIKDLIALAKAKPGTLTYGSSGIGTILHLGGELFKSMAGVDILHVPYKGTSEVVLDLIAGRIDLSIISPLVARKLVDDGRVVALATTGKTRAKGWDTVPTVMEDGLPGYELDNWYPLLAPAGTPDDVVAKLNGAVAAGVQSPAVKAKFVELGLTPVGSTVAEAEALQSAEATKWGKLIKDAKLSAD